MSEIKVRRPKPAKRGEAHMSMRVHLADKRKFTKLCRDRAVPQSELFRRFVAAAAAASAKTKVITIRITGYSPV